MAPYAKRHRYAVAAGFVFLFSLVVSSVGHIQDRVAGFSISSLVASFSVSPMPEDPVTSSADKAVVLRVIDGDTIELADGRRVRYIGIDTPEISDGNRSCFGQDAAEENRRLVEGKTVLLRRDVSDTDRYGRLLRYVYADGVFVNEALVWGGFAVVSTYPPDVSHAEDFLSAQADARTRGAGLWSACPR